jgi:hypothetical protein
MQKQEIRETLPVWAIDVAHSKGVTLSDPMVEFRKLTPKTVTFEIEGESRVLYKRDAWKR